jgi:hypothetical protein
MVALVFDTSKGKDMALAQEKLATGFVEGLTQTGKINPAPQRMSDTPPHLQIHWGPSACPEGSLPEAGKGSLWIFTHGAAVQVSPSCLLCKSVCQK